MLVAKNYQVKLIQKIKVARFLLRHGVIT